ncbi:MAG: hypothetical protein ACRDIV_20615 [Ktedonobacteraceae bacterium]
MDEAGGKSEVARTVHQIDLEREAAGCVLHGFAITARHDFINARMQRSGEYLLHLIDEGKHEEALALMNSDDWGGDHKQKTKQQRHTKKQKGSKRG